MMFETGDYVIYGHTGICQVMGTTTMDMDGIPKDRLYYVLIPILEQKRAMVKIEVSSKQDRHNTMGEKKYKNIDLWVKIGNDATFPENINMRIEDLLNSYRESV